MYAEDDPGLERLRAAIERRREHRCASLAPAAEATRPIIGLHEPAAQAVRAPDAEPSVADVGLRVYWCVRELLEERGTRDVAASRVALRAAKLAVIDCAGYQPDAARLLGVSARQARRDRALLREIDPRDLLDPAPLPPVPTADLECAA